MAGKGGAGQDAGAARRGRGGAPHEGCDRTEQNGNATTHGVYDSAEPSPGLGAAAESGPAVRGGLLHLDLTTKDRTPILVLGYGHAALDTDADPWFRCVGFPQESFQK